MNGMPVRKSLLNIDIFNDSGFLLDKLPIFMGILWNLVNMRFITN